MRLKSLFASCWLNNLGLSDPAFALARGSILFLMIVLPFGHNAALKNIAVLGMLIAAIWLTARRQLDVDWRSPILAALAGMLLSLTITAGLGIEPVDSLGELRKHFLPGVLLFLLIPATFRGEHLVRLLLSVIAMAFLARTGLTLVELANYLPDLNAGRSDGNFIKGYSLDAGFYIPVILSLLLLGTRWRWLATITLIAVLSAMLLVQSRTPVAAALVAVTFMLLLLRKWRILLGCLSIVLASGTYIGVSQPEIAERFAKAISPQTYTQAFDTRNFQLGDGFSGRTPIWLGVIEITEKRAWTGYGFGWKKLASVAMEGGYVARWETQKDDVFATEQARYFSQQASTVNPHNLYLQLYFESGLFGLVVYMLMLLILLAQAARLAWRGNEFNRVLGAMAFAYMVDHIVLGMFNGLLIGLGPSLAIIAIVELARLNEKKA